MEDSSKTTGENRHSHVKKRSGLNELHNNRIEPGKRDKKAKTTYFFNPINKLTVKSAEEKLRDALEKESKPETVNSGHEKASVQVKTPVKDNAYDKLIQELQSSDDSFDGVRWKATPSKADRPKQVLQSSPLKGNEMSSTRHQEKNQVVDMSGIFENDPTTTVLDKYGLGVSGMVGSTPVMSRSVSDTMSTESKHKKNDKLHFETSPLLTKAKSNIGSVMPDVFRRPKLISSKSENASNILNNWIDKFDQKNPTTSTEQKASESEHYNFDQVSSQKRTMDVNLSSVQFDQDFSDSSTDSSPSRPISGYTTKSAEVQMEKEEEMSDDPFSDDEDILNAISAVSQKTSDKAPSYSCTSRASGSDIIIQTEAAEHDAHLLSDSDGVFSDDDSIVETIGALEGSSSVRTKPKNNPDKEKVSGISEKSIAEVKNDAKISFRRKNLQRFTILSILKNSYKVNGKKKSQLILEVNDEDKDTTRLVVRGEYVDLDYQLNDVIHVIITDESNPNLIDDTKNLLIWNPDILVSATTVSQQLSCPRKTVLMNRFRFPGESTPALLVGIIIHSIFQSCFTNENWSTTFMAEVMEVEIEKQILNIYCMGDKVEELRGQISEQFPFLEEWFIRYYKKPFSNSSFIPTNRYNHNVLFSINQALDIEENIWSPTFGIKGMIDVTIEANLRDKASNGNYLLPMEIKTGREHISHQAQSSLYSLLIKDRYGLDVISFLLVYTKERITKKYDISPTDLKSLVNLRNRITRYLKEDTRELPKVLKQSQCDRCEIQESCMTIFKLTESGTAEGSGLDEDIYNDITSHLDNEAYRAFYDYWDSLITKEESVMMSLKKNFWKFTANERELVDGKGIGNLSITNSNDTYDNQADFLYTFKRKIDDQEVSFQNSQLTKYDKVIISDEEGHFAIAQGFIVAISSKHIEISTKRRIVINDMKLKSLNGQYRQSLASVLHKSQAVAKNDERTFRVDKDDMFHGLGLARYNLLSLFLAHGDVKRRSVVVDLKEPSFANTPILKGSQLEGFNLDQISAIKAVTNCEDYCLLLGMPGTGKTTVIASLISLMVRNNKTVLLASYTHSAVDNILLKVKKLGIDVLRVGSPSRVHKDLISSIPGSSRKIESYVDFCDTYLKPKVVAATCLGINDVTFNIRTHFDYCIIDEASQVSMPISLGPLRFCDKFILVGDHYQLPPLVQHPSIEVKKGLSKSLFKSLADAHPSSVTELCHQYRMCEDIMYLSNELIYGNRLRCGSTEVALATLHIPKPDRINKFINNGRSVDSQWMTPVLLPENRVLFMNHDSMPAQERRRGDNIDNPVEADLIGQMVEMMIETGVPEKNIGIISLYRAQVRSLSRMFLHRPDIDVMTADQFQGKDKECIIISFVRSNKELASGDLVKEWSRVNVAITRSKTKLVMLGSRSTLSSAPTIKNFMVLLEKKGWIYILPPDANLVYNCPSLQPSQKTNDITQKPPKVSRNHPIIRDIINNND